MNILNKIIKSMQGVFKRKDEDTETSEILTFDTHLKYKTIADSKREMSEDVRRFGNDFKKVTYEANQRFNPA